MKKQSKKSKSKDAPQENAVVRTPSTLFPWIQSIRQSDSFEREFPKIASIAAPKQNSTMYRALKKRWKTIEKIIVAPSGRTPFELSLFYRWRRQQNRCQQTRQHRKRQGCQS